MSYGYVVPLGTKIYVNGVLNRRRIPLGPVGPAGYTFEVTTTAPNTVFTLRTADAVNYDVDWGDGDSDTGVTSNAQPHTYVEPGTYTVTVETSATFRFFANNVAPDDLLLTSVVDAPADFPWSSIFSRAWRGCSNLTSFPLIDVSNGTEFSQTWLGCSGLTSFPLLDFSNATTVFEAWLGCSSLTSFPLIDTSNATSIRGAWLNCTNLTSFPLLNTSNVETLAGSWFNCTSLASFPLIDTSNVTDFERTWQNCSSLTSFPLIDTSSGIDIRWAWAGCSGLTSFPVLDLSSGVEFLESWNGCSSLTSFPFIDVSNGLFFRSAWLNCSNLVDFPAGLFDSLPGTPISDCFVDAWAGCDSLSSTSVENILNSIDASGQSAPGSGREITIDYDAGSGTPSIATAVSNLTSRNWQVVLNGVAL